MALGAYAVEKDYSHYVAYSARTILAVVGTATKGPVGVATVCTSAQDLVNKFGPLTPTCYALYAGQYFLSQSSKLYFVRAASEDLAAATTNIRGYSTGSTELEDAITLTCLEEGTYFNDFTVTVTAASGKYNLIVRSKSGTLLETLKGVDVEDLGISYSKSSYFKVSAVNSATVSLKEGIYSFSGGNDGIEDIEAADYINAAQVLEPETIDMNLLAVPGVSDMAVITAMLSLVENRGDCLYIIDPPAGLTRDGVVAWHNGGGDYQHPKLLSSYGALYYDWVTIYDSVNKVKVLVPPSVVVATSYAYSDRTADLWYAPAGLQRGIVHGVIESSTKLSKGDVEYLYGGDNNINPLYDDPQVGLVLWGQKTLQREDSALNRVNVRRLLNYLKRVITAACNYLVFEPNDRLTWNSFEMKMQPILDNIKEKRGLYDYRIVRGESIVTDADIDNYRMPCMIIIRPTKSAEEIPIYFAISSTGADFNEVLEANGIINE